MSRPTGDETSPPPRRRPAERRAGAIDAFIDLVLEQDAAPRPEEIAERAGVSIASLYRYFENLDELHRDAIARVMDRFPDLFAIPAIGTGGREQRIARFASARVALHETLHPLQLLARSRSRTDPATADRVDGGREAMADQVRLHFDAELRDLSPTRRRDTVATIAVLTSVESWEQFRRAQGRSAAQTQRAWADAIARVLPPP